MRETLVFRVTGKAVADTDGAPVLDVRGRPQRVCAATPHVPVGSPPAKSSCARARRTPAKAMGSFWGLSSMFRGLSGKHI